MLVHPAGAERRVRRGDGGCPRSLRAPLRSGLSGRVHGREATAAFRKPAEKPALEGRQDRVRGQRIHTERDGRRLPVHRAFARLAQGRCAAGAQDAGGLAREIRWLLEEQYSDAVKVVLVMDNLSTHAIASLYKAFPPACAAPWRGGSKSITHTPRHGIWLDMAEIELSAMTVQCLAKRRIPDLETLRELLKPWCHDRNSRQKGVEWHFRTEEARIKLKHLYPIIIF